jgi:hypothetical protein
MALGFIETLLCNICIQVYPSSTLYFVLPTPSICAAVCELDQPARSRRKKRKTVPAKMVRPPDIMKWGTCLLLGAWAIITASTNDEFVPVLHSRAPLMNPRGKSSDMQNDDINFDELDEYLSNREIGASSSVSASNGEARSSPVEQKHADILSQPLKVTTQSAMKSPSDCSLALWENQEAGSSLHMQAKTISMSSQSLSANLAAGSSVQLNSGPNEQFSSPCNITDDLDKSYNLDEFFDLLEQCMLFIASTN